MQPVAEPFDQHGRTSLRIEQFQQKSETVLRPELWENKEIERFRDSEKSGNALDGCQRVPP
jgi:hypothetical protein